MLFDGRVGTRAIGSDYNYCMGVVVTFRKTAGYTLATGSSVGLNQYTEHS